MIELVFIGYLREIWRWFYEVTCRDYYHHQTNHQTPISYGSCTTNNIHTILEAVAVEHVH